LGFNKGVGGKKKERGIKLNRSGQEKKRKRAQTKKKNKKNKQKSKRKCELKEGSIK
jgi:hypothetical protein